MENDQNSNQEKVIHPTGMPEQQQQQQQQPVSQQVVSSDSTEPTPEKSSSIPFARYFEGNNRKKALIFILLPLSLFAIGQSGPFFIAVLLMSPVLLIFMVYGVILFFKKDDAIVHDSDFSSPIEARQSKSSYKHSIIMLILGLGLLLIAFLSVLSVRSSAGYSGSEGEIVSFPFIISGAVLVFISVITFIITAIKNVISD